MRSPCLSLACVALLAGCGDSGSDDAVQLDPDPREPESMATQPLRPGLWELSETIGEVDQATMRAREEAEIEEDGHRRGETRTVCLPADYADRPPVEFWSGAGNVCAYDRFDAVEGDLGAALSCNATPGTVSVALDGAYGATEFDLAMTVTRTGTGDENITVDGRLEGEWLGECPVAEEEEG